MKNISPHIQLLIGLCLVGLLSLIGEYLLLGWYPSFLIQAGIPEKVIPVLGRVMPWIRLGMPWLFMLTLISLRSEPLESSSKGFPQPSTLVIVLGAGLIIIAYLFIWRLPAMNRLYWRYGYPAALLVIVVLVPLVIEWIIPRPTWGIQTTRKRQDRPLGFAIRLINGWINITQPHRGVLVVGNPGSGKTYSLVEPLIEQAIEKGFSGIIYDFKFPQLADVAFTNMLKRHQGQKMFVINFTDLSRTHRVNPLHPDNLPSLPYALEYAEVIISNLVPESILRKDFWIRSTIAYLASVIWFLKKHFPRWCTLPHVVGLIGQLNYEGLLNLLKTDIETAGLVAPLVIALEKEADKQIAGVLATVQTALAKLNTPEIAWVMSDSDFDLSINDPENPKLLLIGNNSDLTDALAPAISLIISVALKQMNRPGKHPSLLLLDEAPTLFIPKLELIPATGRSNKISTVYIAQDLSQIVNGLGKNQAEMLLGTLSTQIFGKASNRQTADYVSGLFGKEEKEMISRHRNRRKSMLDVDQSLTLQKRESQLLRSQEVIDLQLGEFVGITAGKRNQWFRGVVKRKKPRISEPLPSFIDGGDVARNFERIQHEVKNILS